MAATEGDIVLEVDQLTVAYYRAPVVRDLTLTVRSGEVVALLGANGAGKTTTLRAVSGLLKPGAGGRLEQPGDRPQRRGLARAVGAEQRDNLAGAYGQRQVAHDRRLVVGDAQRVKFEYRVGPRHCANPP